MGRRFQGTVQLTTVFLGGDAVNLAEGFHKAAVVGKAVFQAGGEHRLPGGQIPPTALHTQSGQVLLHALHSVFLKDTGEVLPADIGPAGKLGDG